MPRLTNRWSPADSGYRLSRADIGALIIFSATTLLTKTGLGANLGQVQDVLFFLQVISLLASIVSVVGLVTRKPLGRQFLFDVGIHGSGEIPALGAEGVAPVMENLLHVEQATLSGLGWSDVPIFLDGRLR